MQSVIECPVCVEIYTPTSHVPKNLPCGHGVCELCVRSLLSAATGPAISCPTCSAASTIPDKQAEKLSTNFPILQLLGSLCGDCRDRPHTQRCGHYPLNVCDVCRKTHQRDLTTDLTDDITELKQAMADINRILPNEKDFQIFQERGEHIMDKMTENYKAEKPQLEERYQTDRAKVKAEIQQNIDMLLVWKEKSNKFICECESLLEKYRYQIQQQLSDSELVSDQNSKHRSKIEALKQMKECKPNEVNVNSEQIPHSFKILSIKFTHMSRETQTDAVIISTPVPDYSAASYKAIFDHQLTWPMDICTDSSTGHIIATDNNKHEVIVLTADLQLVTRFGGWGLGANQYNCPWGVAVSDGQLWVCDELNHRIHVTDLRGMDLCVFGSWHAWGQGKEHCYQPVGLSCDSAGLLYICDANDKRIKVTDRRGSFVREFGLDVLDGIPGYNAVSADGRVAVTTITGNNIYMFTISGQHITTLNTNTPPHQITTRGVAFDDHGHLLVADCAGGRVAVMTETGDVVCFIGTPGAGPGQLKEPWGLAVTRDGDVVVCDKGNKRIQLFKVPKRERGRVIEEG